MFSLFTFINVLDVLFKWQSGSSDWELRCIVNAFYDLALFIEAGRPAALFMVELVPTAIFSADTPHREA